MTGYIGAVINLVATETQGRIAAGGVVGFFYRSVTDALLPRDELMTMPALIPVILIVGTQLIIMPGNFSAADTIGVFVAAADTMGKVIAGNIMSIQGIIAAAD